MGNSQDPLFTHPTLPLNSVVYNVSCNSPGSPSSPQQSCSNPASPGSHSSSKRKRAPRPYNTDQRHASYERCKQRKKEQEELEKLQHQQQLELLQQQQIQAQVELLVQQRLVCIVIFSLFNSLT